jgi:hypothetical protein
MRRIGRPPRSDAASRQGRWQGAHRR